MSRLVRFERAFHRFDEWLDRVWLSPSGLAFTFIAIVVLLASGALGE